MVAMEICNSHNLVARVMCSIINLVAKVMCNNSMVTSTLCNNSMVTSTLLMVAKDLGNNILVAMVLCIILPNNILVAKVLLNNLVAMVLCNILPNNMVAMALPNNLVAMVRYNNPLVARVLLSNILVAMVLGSNLLVAKVLLPNYMVAMASLNNMVAKALCNNPLVARVRFNHNMVAMAFLNNMMARARYHNIMVAMASINNLLVCIVSSAMLTIQAPTIAGNANPHCPYRLLLGKASVLVPVQAILEKVQLLPINGQLTTLSLPIHIHLTLVSTLNRLPSIPLIPNPLNLFHHPNGAHNVGTSVWLIMRTVVCVITTSLQKVLARVVVATTTKVVATTTKVLATTTTMAKVVGPAFLAIPPNLLNLSMAIKVVWLALTTTLVVIVSQLR